jgi:hypothetical protein
MTLFLAKDMRSIFVRGRPEGFEVPNTVILFGHKKSASVSCRWSTHQFQSADLKEEK